MPEGADYKVILTVSTTFWAKDYLDAVQFAIKVGASLQNEELEVEGENCSGLVLEGLDVEGVFTGDEDGMEVE